eukprot:7612514-Pyramimonas_sp.AAC.1
MDGYAPPKDHKLEARPRRASTPQRWFQDAERESRARACFYCQEHYGQQVKAAEHLLSLNEEAEYA